MCDSSSFEARGRQAIGSAWLPGFLIMVSFPTKFCVAFSCKRKEPHRTRRRNAEGQPDCCGVHGQTGMRPRGEVARRIRLQRPKLARTPFALLPAKRMSRKAPISQLRFATNVSSPLRNKKIRLAASFETPAQRTSLSSMYGAPRNVDRAQRTGVAAGQPQQASATTNQLAIGVGHWRQSGTRTHAPDGLIVRVIANVNDIIDGSVMQELTDEGCRHALKASVWRVVKELGKDTRASALAAAVARKPKSITLAVFCTALALTLDMGGIDERDLLRRLEPDQLARADAFKTQPSILNIMFSSSGLSPTQPALAPRSVAA